ncbi:MAG: hypothetical protein QME40_01260 [bacterium]|nr:hypothetical protein [bacterium]
MRKRLTTLISLFFYIGLTSTAYAVVWPNAPSGKTYPNYLESDYGPRKVYQYFHKGLDFPDDKNIKAVESGKVEVIATSNSKYHYEICGGTILNA